MFDLLSRRWGMLVFRGVIGVLFGLSAMLLPGLTLYVLVFLWGAFALIDGISAISMGATTTTGGRGFMVVTGIIGVIAGIIALVWPGITAVALLLVIAAWALITGVTQLVAAWRLRKEITGEWLLALTGIVSIALGVVLFLQPAAGALALVFTIGALATVWGVFTIILGLRMRSISRQRPTGSMGRARPA